MTKRSRRSYVLTRQGLAKLTASIRKVEKSQGLGGKGFSNEKLGELTGLSTDTVRKVLQGKKAVDKKSLTAFETSFQISFLERVDYAKPEYESNNLNSEQCNRNILRQRPKINLPFQSNKFIGRQDELKELLEEISLDYRSPIVTVDGIGGVGKTALVLEAAYLCLEASVGASVYLDAPIFDSIIFSSAKEDYLYPYGVVNEEPEQIQNTLRDIFRVIAITLDDKSILQAPPDQQRSLVYESLGKQRTLLIIDNFETVEPQDREHIVRFLLKLPGNVKAVVTTRERVVFHACMRLDCLPEEDSLTLMRQQAKEKKISVEDDQLKKIHILYGGVPVALIYTIGQIAKGYSLEALLDFSIPLPDDVAGFCFRRSVRPLRGKAAHKLLMALSIFRRSPLIPVLAEVAGLSSQPIEVEQGLAELKQLSLLSCRRGRYRMLPLTREYAKTELVANLDFENEARKRWINWYLDYTKKYGGKDWQEWHLQYDHIDIEWKNILAVLNWCASRELYSEIKEMWRNLDEFASLYGYWEERLLWLNWILREASERRGDVTTAIEIQTEISFTWILMGELEKAKEVLLKGWKQRWHGTLENQAFLAQQFSLLRISEKKYNQAIQWLNLKSKIIERADFSVLESERRRIAIIYLRAEIFYNKKDYDKAKRLYRETIDRSTSIGWQRKKNAAQYWLAKIEIIHGNITLAAKLLRDGLSEAIRNKAKKSIAEYRKTLAVLEYHKGNYKKSDEWLSEAMKGFEELGIPVHRNATIPREDID